MIPPWISIHYWCFKVNHEPDWSLDDVLEFLSSPRFRRPTLKDLTYKTVFLFGLATADRVSEIHSYLRGSSIQFDKNLKYVKIFPNAKFLAKKELPSARRQPFYIPALMDKEGKNHSPVCPVLSLYMYLKASRECKTPYLFVNPRTFSRASKLVISQILRNTVKWACPNAYPNAYDVRAISATKAFFAAMRISIIKKRASWKSGKVFTNHYLRKELNSDRSCISLRSKILSAFDW